MPTHVQRMISFGVLFQGALLQSQSMHQYAKRVDSQCGHKTSIPHKRYFPSQCYNVSSDKLAVHSMHQSDIEFASCQHLTNLISLFFCSSHAGVCLYPSNALGMDLRRGWYTWAGMREHIGRSYQAPFATTGDAAGSSKSCSPTCMFQAISCEKHLMSCGHF